MSGPAFDYTTAPNIFLGRDGSGPLRIVWDTSVLILFQKYGETFWDDGPVGEPDHLRDQIEALGTIVNPLWLTRDIRFQVLPKTLIDFQRYLPDPDGKVRERFIDAIEAARLFGVGFGDEDYGPPAPTCEPIPRETLACLPRRGLDRQLVDEAQRVGAHVFLTNDKKLAQKAPQIAPYGLLLVRPTQLLDELGFAGELTRRPDWPAPDLQRVVELLRPFSSNP
jgi:hypothetical protein